MKKKLFFAVVAIGLLASCAENEYVGEVTPNPNPGNGTESAIVFSSGTKAITRTDKIGEGAANDLNKNFVFKGTKTTSHTNVFIDYQANYKLNTAHQTESNSNDWEYVSYKNVPAGVTTNVGVVAFSTSNDNSTGVTQSIKYWDYATDQYDFAAYSLGKGTGTTPTYATSSAINMANVGTSNTVYTLTGSVDQLKACYISDLLTAYNRDGVSDYGNVVTFKFRSLATKIRLAFYETIPGYSVKNINFYSVAEGGTASTTPTLFTSTAVLPSGSGKMEITYPTTGFNKRPNGSSADTDYNKAHVKFTQADQVEATSTLTFEAINNFATSAEGQIAANTSPYIGRASNDASYAGGLVDNAGKYYTILPFEDGANLLLRINYTLVSTDDSNEEINVKNATAVVPAELAKWNPNYAYTYIFKISDMTNGSTGVDGDNKIVTGLTPITLDAVVVDSEDGVQETITTVSEPSITTYMAGKIITSNDEYKYVDDSTPIYIIVNSGTSNQTLVVSGNDPNAINAELYTATIADGAVQTISEESVDNALTNGAKDSETAPTTWTVTDINSKTLVVTKSNLLQASSEIAAADSPTGNVITVPGAKFIPANANTTYVFRYKTAAVGEGYDAGTVLVQGTNLKGYYTKSGTTYTECSATGTADGSTVYYRKTNAKAAGYQYKIIKVVAGSTTPEP